ncbi:TRAM domain-containing protein [Natronomonas sp. CBA1123]|nr:TRAM domain-containing protein [Natronomonas sp. CBA1123]
MIEVPEQEIRLDNLQQGETYRVAVFPSPSNEADESEIADTEIRQGSQTDPEKPPVEEGETRRVEIDGIGDQGDGITRVERGFVVIVPDTEQGERVAIEITDVRENVAFSDVVERLSYYD